LHTKAVFEKLIKSTKIFLKMAKYIEKDNNILGL
jgi:hypothetical protein